MHNLEDLNIEKELLPLFDYSLNIYAKEKIIEILKTPLQSTNKIIERQNILKGFTENNEILKSYSYSNSYITEVYLFLNDEKIEDVTQAKLKYKLLTNKKEKIRKASKFNQLILFL
jgi:DNA mismatch repair protein MutS